MLYPKIRELRILHDLKQEYVADQLGISQPEYSRLENGHRHARIEDFRRLSKMYDVSISSLMLKDQDLAYGSRQSIPDVSRTTGPHLNALLAHQEEMIAHILQKQQETEVYLKEILLALGKDIQANNSGSLNES